MPYFILTYESTLDVLPVYGQKPPTVAFFMIFVCDLQWTLGCRQRGGAVAAQHAEQTMAPLQHTKQVNNTQLHVSFASKLPSADDCRGNSILG